MNELRQIVGTEVPLDQFHLMVRRAAANVGSVSNYGTCLVSCADERNGLVRGGFDRDVATPLISDVANARDRVFAISNLCGRLEPGAFALVNDHFIRPSARGGRLLIMEIASHVGRVRVGSDHVYGHVERFGRSSPCCGALTALLNPRTATAAVRHPWFEQLNAFFGPVRLAALRGRDASTRMVAAAIIHAGLQAESAVAEVFQDLPDSPADVIIVAGVAVNQQWADGFLPVAWHHIRAGNGTAEIVAGFSLRTTPEALRIDISGPRIVVDGGRAMEDAPIVQRRPVEPALGQIASEELAMLPALPEQQREALEEQLDAVRSQVETLRRDPTAWRTYSRPILRSLFRGLCMAQPEIGVAAMLYEGGEQIFAARKLRQVLQHGPSSPAGRQILHEIEAELQQLNHEDAQQVLDSLLASRK